MKSMTGYGLARLVRDNYEITAEIKSLNSKFLELSVKLPKGYSEYEMAIRTESTGYIERGKATVTLEILPLNRLTENPLGSTVNDPLFIQYYHKLHALATQLNADASGIFNLCMQMPGVVGTPSLSYDQEDWVPLYDTFKQAMGGFQDFRIREGESLYADIEGHALHIVALLNEIEALDPGRIPAIKERIAYFLEEQVEKSLIDRSRLEQEFIYYIEKLDISEEKVRLKAHCDYFLVAMTESGSGKKLGFIAQEMGREINTIGSKASDLTIQKTVVLMKEALEKIKEQLLNIL